MDRARRKQLQDDYRQAGPEAGVFRIVNTRTGRVLLGSSTNLASVRSKIEFAQKVGMPGALDRRLRADAEEVGVGAFEFEIVDRLDAAPDRTAEQVRDDLTALEALWREREDPAGLY